MPSDDWFIGFIEGEGSFTNAERGDTPGFSVGQKAREVCDMLRAFFDFGHMYQKPDGSWEYQVTNYKSCRKVALFLRGKLVLAHKRERFEDWCERFQLLNDEMYYPSGRRVLGTRGCGSRVQVWMDLHPKEVAAIAAEAGIADKEVIRFDNQR